MFLLLCDINRNDLNVITTLNRKSGRKSQQAPRLALADVVVSINRNLEISNSDS